MNEELDEELIRLINTPVKGQTKWAKENPEKTRVHQSIRHIDWGIQSCAHCGAKEDIVKHHEDYSKPLDVIFLCRPCHKIVHSKLTKKDVQEIRQLRGYVIQRKLAEAYGVSKATIEDIHYERSWKDHE